MKVSKQDKEKTRLRLIDAAVEIISKRGLRIATMREIAERADVGDATIYKYFPTKESLLFGYFEVVVDELIERLQKIPDFHTYSLREQLHTLLETRHEIFAPNHAFIQTAYEGVFLTNWIAAAAASRESKDRYLAIIEDLLDAAVEAGEIPEPPFKTQLLELFWEYSIGVTYYWLKDESPKRANTTEMIDKSLAMVESALKSDLLNRAVELGQFMLREHLLSRLKKLPGDRNFDLPKLKRKLQVNGAEKAHG